MPERRRDQVEILLGVGERVTGYEADADAVCSYNLGRIPCRFVPQLDTYWLTLVFTNGYLEGTKIHPD